MWCNAVGPAVEYETMWLSADTANCGDYFHKLCGIRKLPHFGGRSHIDICLLFRETSFVYLHSLSFILSH